MSNTTTHTPVKVRFTRSEVCKLIDCKNEWLRYWADKLGFLDEDKGKQHRYSVPEINALTEIRKTKKGRKPFLMFEQEKK